MQEQIKGVDVANVVRLKRSHSPKSAFLIVEGSDDCKLLRRQTDQFSCSIEIGYGKEKVIDAILILDRDGFRGALGIVDADFDIIEGRTSPSPNLLLTDLHDVECMMLCSPAFSHVLGEIGVPAQIIAFEAKQGLSVREHLLKVGAVVGTTRLASARHGWSLKFDGLDFSKFVGVRDLEIDRQQFFDEIRSHQGGANQPPPTFTQIVEVVHNTQAPSLNLWHLCQGHDLLDILSVGLRRCLSSKNESEIRREKLEAMLRLGFEAVYFQATGLYAGIRDWEARSIPFRILP